MEDRRTEERVYVSPIHRYARLAGAGIVLLVARAAIDWLVTDRIDPYAFVPIVGLVVFLFGLWIADRALTRRAAART